MVGHGNVSHEMDRNLNVSPEMSYGVLECDIVMLQNYMLTICNKRFLHNKKWVLFIQPDPVFEEAEQTSYTELS